MIAKGEDIMAILAFDAGGSSVKHAVIDRDGRILAKGKFTTPATLEEFLSGYGRVKAEYAAQYQLEGAGCSMPGAVDDAAGIIGSVSSIPYIHNFNIKAELEKVLELPVSMENDANCAALGEAWVGRGQDYQDILFLVIGSGVGGAVVKDKRIHHGRHFLGGEFGFMAVDEQGTILSEAGSTRALAESVAKAKGLSLTEMNGEKVFALLEQGDEDAAKAVDNMYMVLARTIYNLQYSFDPEIFVLGGAISERSDFAQQIDSCIDHIMKQVGIATVKPVVTCCQHGNDANLLGAAYDFVTKYTNA